MKIITRNEYMENSDKLFRPYYGQFVNDNVKQHLLNNIALTELLLSKDEHLNDIKIARWDALGGFMFRNSTGELLQRPTNIEPIDIKLLREAKEGVSSATLVCIYKEAARQIIEDNKK